MKFIFNYLFVFSLRHAASRVPLSFWCTQEEKLEEIFIFCTRTMNQDVCIVGTLVVYVVALSVSAFHLAVYKFSDFIRVFSFVYQNTFIFAPFLALANVCFSFIFMNSVSSVVSGALIDLLIDFKRCYIRSLKLTLTHYLRRYTELTFIQFHSLLRYLDLKIKLNTRISYEFILQRKNITERESNRTRYK